MAGARTSIKESAIRLVELAQNLLDLSLLYSERNYLIQRLGNRAYKRQTSPVSDYSNDLIAEIRILDGKIKDVDEELANIFQRKEETDPFDWI